MADGVDDI